MGSTGPSAGGAPSRVLGCAARRWSALRRAAWKGPKLLEAHFQLSADMAETRARSSLARTAQVLRVTSDVQDATVECWKIPAWVEIVSGWWRRSLSLRAKDAVSGESLGAVARQALLQRLVELERR